MTQLQYKLTQDESEANLTIFYQGKTFPVHSSHKFWADILKAALADDPKAVELADVGLAVGQRLALSMRVSYINGKLYLDNDEMADGLATHVVRMIQSGDDVQPFVLLLENIAQNPSANSRQQLSTYVDRNDITITHEGILVLYKIVNRFNSGHFPNTASQDGWVTKQYQSCHAGPAIVSGCDWASGFVPQSQGDVVEMARSKVIDNPGTHCTTGLHVGAWSYVKSGPVRGNVILEVHVNPRDVVSVPHDHNQSKIRVCRYVIVGERTEPYTEPVITDSLVKPIALATTAPEPEAPVRGITPTPTTFNALKLKARAQKKGLKRYLESKGYRQINPDVSPEAVEDRKNWVH